MIVALALLAMLRQLPPAAAPTHSYLFFVASEGTDQVALVRYDASGMAVQHRTTLRLVPGDLATPAEVYTDSGSGKSYALKSAHGLPPADLVSEPRHLAVAPDGSAYFVTSLHGFPAGELVKVMTVGDSAHGWRAPDMVLGREPMSGTPGALQVSGANGYAFVVTRGAGDHAGGSGITVVDARAMVQVATVPTCAAPLGAQLSGDGARLYTLCSADDALVEIDVPHLKVARRLPLAGATGAPCRPTALIELAGGSTVLVACSASHDVAELEAATGAILRRVAATSPVSGLLATPDGRVLVTLHDADSSLTIRPLADAASAVTVALGGTPVAAAASADNRLVFVTLADGTNGIGSIVAVDLASRRIATRLEYGRRLVSIVFWKELR